MTKIKCIAIDDEPLALKLIEQYISGFPILQLAGTFEDAISGAEFLKKSPVDLLFVDINMPDISGIDLVRSLEVKPMVIFTTAYRNFAYEGFELEALDYLVKPIDIKRFTRAVDKVVDYYNYKNQQKSGAESESIYVYSEYKLVKVPLDEIEYIESMEDYIKIYTTTADKPVLTLMPLKKILEKLPQDKFRRIHRCYIVSVNKVRSIQNKKVRLTKAELPISESYSSFIKDWAIR